MPGVSPRLSDLTQTRSLTGTGGNSLVWRMDHWDEVLQLAGHDTATGIGMDMVRFVSPGGTLPHNDFVRMYVEAGWLGLLALLALGAGAHVACEKPMAMTVAEALRMEEARAEAGAHGAINFSYRNVPAFRHARELVAAGAPGPFPICCRSRFWSSVRRFHNCNSVRRSASWRVSAAR